MKKAFQKDEELLGALASVGAQAGEEELNIWWLGQSGFLLIWNNRRILLDPYLSDSLTTKYAHTDKPHVRITERVIAPERLPVMDIVTSSHNHTDHLDAETLKPILAHSPEVDFLIPEANRKFVADRLGCALDFPVGINDGESVVFKGVKIHAVLAAHNDIERDEKGRSLYLGYVLTCGPWNIYHSGDTLLYPGMVEVLKLLNVHIAFLPINGHDPARRVAGNLNGEEAARLGKDIGAELVIPHHFDLFEFNTASPELFESKCRELNQKFYTMKVGEGLCLNKS
ncbi:MAG: MBL fold metallo-hydrolase [Cyclobacteriaceae bacterium]